MNREEAKEKYEQLINSAKKRCVEDCLSFYENHHIIPKCVGGLNNEENLVRLTCFEHILAHYYLCFIYDNNINILRSFCLMIKANQINKVTLEEKSILEQIEEISEIREKFYRLNRGSNHSSAGKIISEETRKKLSESHKGKKWSNLQREKFIISRTGKSHKSGYHLSDETKEKLRIANLGKEKSDETKEKLRIANLGKSVSEETRKKMSILHLGKKKSEETRKKISEGNKGKTVSEETRKKISEGNKGKKRKPQSELAKFKKGVAVVSTDKNGNSRIYKSFVEAAKETSTYTSSIYSCCLGKRKTAGKLFWRYATEEEIKKIYEEILNNNGT